MEQIEDEHIRAFLDDRTNIDFETLEQLKVKRQNLLLARTAPVENSEEKPEPIPLPPKKKTNAVERRKQLQTSRSVSQCRVSNIANVGITSTTWKSFSSLDFDGTGAVRTSKRLRDKHKKKDVRFGEVEVFYFKRNLGLSTVPSLEGAALGMADKHYLQKKYTFYEYSKAALKQNEQKWTMIRKTIEDHKKAMSPRRSSKRGSGILINKNFPSTLSKAAFERMTSQNSVDEIEKSVSDLTNELVNHVVDVLEKESDNDKNKEESDETSEDEPDEVIPFIEPEMMQPLDKTIRHAILSSSDVHIDPEFEDDYSKEIRESRTKVGCSCKSICQPEICECSINSIKCQVDHDEFPCGCSSEACSNPEGRVEFNPLRVRTHYLTTLKLLKDMEKVKYTPTRFSPRHIRFPDDEDDIPSTSTSYLSTPPPQIYQSPKPLHTVINQSNSIECSSPIEETNNNTANIVNVAQTEENTTPSTPTIATNRKYPVTPTYKRTSFSFSNSMDVVLPDDTCNLRRSPRLSPMKRPSMTSIVVVGNVEQDLAPASKKFRSLEASPSNMATFSQTIDEESISSGDDVDK